MKGKQLIYLFVALLLPGCIFMFLKYFGKNQFAVAPLYQTEAPATAGNCKSIILPYHIPDSVFSQFNAGADSLTIVYFGALSKVEESQLARVHETFKGDPIHDFQVLENDLQKSSWHSCIFFLKEPFNLVLVDNQRRLRGEYNLSDREDVDRLLTEITIILKKY